jgi:hypothetical protein
VIGCVGGLGWLWNHFLNYVQCVSNHFPNTRLHYLVQSDCFHWKPTLSVQVSI